MPVLATLEEEFASEKLAVVTICMRAPAAQARQALQEKNVDLLVLLDEDVQVRRLYRVRATPTTYLIAGDGGILMHDIGYGDGKADYLRGEIRRLLGDWR